MPIDSTPDHVAVAVPSITAAAARWRDHVGGAWASPRMDDGPDFRTQQLRFANRAKLELLEPSTDDGFAAGFLERFGARVHHVTLKVPDLLGAVRTVRDAGYDVVDVSTDGKLWHEAFLRPSQVGGIIAQLAWSSLTDEQWLERTDVSAEPVTGDTDLLGPTLYHPDLGACARVWAVLGGTVESGGTVEARGSRGASPSRSSIEVSWPDAPLTVRVEEREHPADPVLRFRGAPELPADAQLGPATVPPPTP